MNAQETPLLELRNIAKSFKPEVFGKTIHSLQGISLSFLQGRCTGLVGHNGAGKTTTIRLILGLIHQNRGQVLFRGSPMTRIHRSSIGYLAELARFPAGLTCREILETHLALYKIGNSTSRKQLITAKLEEVGLTPFAHRRARQMSKGMQQRLAWAQATIHEPDLLILDEPFSGLDPLGRMMMKNLILSEKKRGLTMILCTHELPQITSLCDHIHILRKGQVVYSSVGTAHPSDSIHNLPRYFVDLSGGQTKDLEALQKNLKLPAWKTIHQDGFILRLGFADYPSAAAWLSPAMHEGLVIVRFGDDNSATEEQLLVHFKEEFTQ